MRCRICSPRALVTAVLVAGAVVASSARGETADTGSTIPIPPPAPPKPASVSGEVEDAAGDWATYAHVRLTSTPRAAPNRHPQIADRQVDEDGQFRFESVEPGTITIHVDARDGDESTDVPPFELEEGERRDGLRLRLAPPLEHPDNLIEGRVLDGTGRPFPRARVAVIRDGFTGRAVTTDEDGSFALKGLAPGRHSLEAHGPGTASVVVNDVETGSRSVTIVVQPRGELMGRVVDDATGEAIVGASVDVATTTADGLFRVRIRRTDQRFYVRAPGYMPATLGPFADASGQTVDAGDVRLGPLADAAGRTPGVGGGPVERHPLIVGTVVDDRGTPLPRIEVLATPWAGTIAPPYLVWSGGDGQFVFASMQIGKWCVRAGGQRSERSDCAGGAIVEVRSGAVATGIVLHPLASMND